MLEDSDVLGEISWARPALDAAALRVRADDDDAGLIRGSASCNSSSSSAG